MNFQKALVLQVPEPVQTRLVGLSDEEGCHRQVLESVDLWFWEPVDMGQLVSIAQAQSSPVLRYISENPTWRTTIYLIAVWSSRWTSLCTN